MKEDFPHCDCEEFSIKKSKSRKSSEYIGESLCGGSPSDSYKMFPVVEDSCSKIPECSEQAPTILSPMIQSCRKISAISDFNRIEDKKFSYFPTSYKMSTNPNDYRKKSEDQLANRMMCTKTNCDTQDACIQLQSADCVLNNKRKHSEMIRLDKLEKDASPFNVPDRRSQAEINARKRINKLMNKDYKRPRIMTECISDVN